LSTCEDNAATVADPATKKSIAEMTFMGGFADLKMSVRY
jgi:hypothetical protein